MRETTSLGAAIAAGFAAGVWKSFDELKQINSTDRTVFEPNISKEKSERMYKLWTKAVAMCKGWVDAEEVNLEGKDKDDEGGAGGQAGGAQGGFLADLSSNVNAEKGQELVQQMGKTLTDLSKNVNVEKGQELAQQVGKTLVDVASSVKNAAERMLS